MQEHCSPARYLAPADANMTDDVFDNAREFPASVVFSRKVGSTWTPVTARQFADEVTALAAGLMGFGIELGDRVALMSKTSYEWMLCDYAIWAAGGVTVPIYDTSSAEQVEWYLSDSGATAAFVETAEHEAIVTRASARLSSAPTIWHMDPGALGSLSTADQAAAERLASRRRSVKASSLATIVYTSGTTGRPKGCVLTHGNLVSEVGNVLLGDGVGELLFNETKSTLLFLPLAHILARVIQLSAVRSRVRLGHTGDIKNIVSELQDFQPTSVLAVPRVFEKVYN